MGRLAAALNRTAAEVEALPAAAFDRLLAVHDAFEDFAIETARREAERRERLR